MSDKLSKNKIYSLNELSIITKKLKSNKKKNCTVSWCI